MAETDFSDLLIAVEQLASEVDGIGELPRVERTPRQVLEASQELWARVTATGAQEIQANLLLGSKGVDLPQLSQKLESLSSKKTFEPLEAVPDTDIVSFVKNEAENAILSLFESSHEDSLNKWSENCQENLEDEWEVEKLELISSMLGKNVKDFLDIPLVPERSFVNDNSMESDYPLTSEEISYGRAVMEYNQAVVKGVSKSKLIDKFARATSSSKDQMLSEMWEIVKFMTQIPPQKTKDPADARNMRLMKTKMISQARNYLENRYNLYMKSVVQSSIKYSLRVGEPNSLVRNFVSIRLPRGYLGSDFVELDGCPLWPLVYYCLRCGDINGALKYVQQAGPGFEEICKALEEIKGSIQRKVSPKLAKLIRTFYKRSVRNDTDPYKRIIFCILGGCDVNDEHSEIIKTADDYLWLKFNQVREEEETDKSDGSECLTYSLLQRLIIEDCGEGHYNAAEQPHVYFQMLFLTGQWEAAIDFLIRNEKLRVHGIHVAIALHEQRLLALPMDVTAPLLAIDPKDPKPMFRLNFARLIKIYVHKFENQYLLEALHYYFFLRNLDDIPGKDNLFAEYVSELLLTTREFEAILGRLELDNSRSPGLIDQFKATKENLNLLIICVAKQSEKKGQYEDAIKLYDLAGKHEAVLRLMIIMLCQVVAQVESEPGSLRSRLAEYANSITVRYSNSKVKCKKEIETTFHTLRDFLKFFDYYAQGHYSEALDIIEKSHLIPCSLNDVDETIRTYQNLRQAISRHIPDILLATMNMLYKQYTQIKGDSQNMSRTYFTDSLKEQLQKLTEKAKALTSFAGGVPFGLLGDVNSRLVQIEILMH